MTETGSPTRQYQHLFFDSARWEGFAFRPGDILVCTSYKAGTTWTQMIAALIVHQTPSLPQPLAELSPWLDMQLASPEDIFKTFEAQDHRRIIKTHTPLDGLPWRDDVTYLYCGREPRDVFMSMQNHMDNLNPEKMIGKLIERGVEIGAPPPAPPEDLNERFKIWMTDSFFDWEQDGAPFWSHFGHAQTFWEHRDRENIYFLHYADLKADLEGEMRKLAAYLKIDVPEEKWPALVKAATFDEMKGNADNTAPDTNHGIWQSNSQFFNKGTNEQWRGALNEESLALYDRVTRERYDETLLSWLEQGASSGVRP